jgi:radical SAM protein with 4Fe4S-binding SPASM domain
MIMSQRKGIADYGRQIDRPGLLDFAPRTKSRTIAGSQARILRAFGRLTPGSMPARIFAQAARRVVGGFLYSLKVEINDRCTMNCRICYVRKGEKELSLRTVRRLFQAIRSCGVRLEILGGEPLLHPDLAGIIRSAKHDALSPFVTLYTNATLATAAMSSQIKAAGLDAAIVSLMSHREAVHDACTRQPGSWSAAVEGMRRLSEAGIKIYTFTPVLRDNVADVPDIYEFVKNRIPASALFYQYIPRSRDDELNIGLEDWRRAKRWITSHGSEHWDFVRRFFMLTGNACSGGNFVLTVKADGSVQPCPFVDDVPMGSILDDDIWSIYRRRFGNRRFQEFKSLPAECRGCSHRSVCGGGCRASARWFGGYGRRDPKCPGPFSAPITAAGILDCIPTFF